MLSHESLQLLSLRILQGGKKPAPLSFPFFPRGCMTLVRSFDVSYLRNYCHREPSFWNTFMLASLNGWQLEQLRRQKKKKKKTWTVLLALAFIWGIWHYLYIALLLFSAERDILSLLVFHYLLWGCPVYLSEFVNSKKVLMPNY